MVSVSLRCAVFSRRTDLSKQIFATHPVTKKSSTAWAVGVISRHLDVLSHYIVSRKGNSELHRTPFGAMKTNKKSPHTVAGQYGHKQDRETVMNSIPENHHICNRYYRDASKMEVILAEHLPRNLIAEKVVLGSMIGDAVIPFPHYLQE